jgi:hypothetical protein
VTYYVLFFLHLGSRRVQVAGVTPHPTEAWMVQMAPNVTMEEWGFLAPGQYLIHDRDTKCCAAFQQLIDAAGVERVVLPPRSPNLHAYAERWVRSVKEECLWRMILFGEASLCHALTQYVAHFHHERNHQGKGNVLLFPVVSPGPAHQGPVQCRERLGGLLQYYTCEAACVLSPAEIWYDACREHHASHTAGSFPMPQGALIVQQDGTLTIQQPPDEDTAALEAALARFADLVCPTTHPRMYRLTAASIWRARRAGLVLEEILQTLTTSNSMEIPPTVRADIT